MVIMDSSNNTNHKNNNNSKKKHERCVFQNVQFALAIVRNPFVESEHFGKWLAVNETKGRGWWIPAGAVENGESFLQACLRECAEEAGMQIQVKGILKVDHSVSGDVCRMRVIYYGEPASLADADNYKKIADAESVEARWVSIDELWHLASTSPGLRGRELLNWAMYLENNGHVFPLEMFGEEGELQPLGSQSVALQAKSEGNTFLRQANDQYNTRVSSTITAEQRQFMEWANARRKDNKFESV
jgi:ADP-ribose pyrophosphatase YjhB (NUDIX family)